MSVPLEIRNPTITYNSIFWEQPLQEGVTGPTGSGGGAMGDTGSSGIPIGGAINQLLVKQSSTDYDTLWTSDISANTIINGEYTGTNIYLSGNLDLEGRLATTSTIIGIGLDSTLYSPGGENIAIGYGAGLDTQGVSSIAMGREAGNSVQGQYSIAIGHQAGYTDQVDHAVSIGYQAGFDNQGSSSVAIGRLTASSGQSNDCVAIGTNAGNGGQAAYATAIGYRAGYSTQNFDTIAIGRNAGYTGQGRNAIAIGNSAGSNVQHANTIILNASGSALDSTDTDRWFVKPVRGVALGLGVGVMKYDTATNEIQYSTT